MPANKRHWSLRRQPSRPATLWRRANRVHSASPRKSESQANASGRVAWLSQAEDLVHAIQVLISRAIGSVFYGFMTLFAPNPVRRLRQLEASGKILSWAGPVVGSSALFSALMPVTDHARLDSSELLVSLGSLGAYGNHLELFLPSLTLGLIWCMAAWTFAKLAGKYGDPYGVRLFASTAYSVSMVGCLVAFLCQALMTLTFWNMRKRGELAFAFGFLDPDVVVLFPLVLVGLAAFAICGARFGWRLGKTISGARLGKLYRLICAAVFATLSAAMGPFFVACALAFGPDMAAAVAQVTSTTAIADATTNAELETYVPECQLNAAANPVAIECDLFAQTGGKGTLLLNLDQPVLMIAARIQGAWQEERFRFRAKNNVSLDQKEAQPGTKFVVRTGQDQFAFGSIATATLNGLPAHGAGGFVAVELGKPLQLKLSVPLEDYCRRGSVRDYFLPRLESKAEIDYFYVLVRQVPSTSRPKATYDYASIGPWVVSDFRAVGFEGCRVR